MRMELGETCHNDKPGGAKEAGPATMTSRVLEVGMTDGWV